eukprot:UN10008
MYLRTPTKGGYTAFPKAAGGRGIKVRPPEGGGVLFIVFWKMETEMIILFIRVPQLKRAP